MEDDEQKRRRAHTAVTSAASHTRLVARYAWRESSRIWRMFRTFVRDYTALSVVMCAAALVTALNVRIYASSESMIVRIFGGGQERFTTVAYEQVPTEYDLAVAPLPIAPPRAVSGDNTTEDRSLEDAMLGGGASAPADTDGDGGDIRIYTVQDGDTISEIARAHHVTVDTILWANEIDDVERIKPGDTIIILATNGVRHTVRRGDTIQSIAKKYKASAEAIISYNSLPANGELTVGEEIVVPDGIKEEPPAPAPRRVQRRTYASLRVARQVAVSRSYYRCPVRRYVRTQGLHRTNAVDLAAPIGTPVYAAAAGRVIIARSSGWNGGYGRYVVIQHPNGTKTLYAHNSRILVKVGQTVKKGQQIAKMGSTGRSTGSHVHFEVRGARNPC